jgi:hypothetical protein
VTYDPVAKEVVAFGGLAQGAGGSSGVSNATWTYHAGTWNELCSPADGDGGCGVPMPPARSGALLTYDGTDKTVLMTGGRYFPANGSAPGGVGRADVWEYAGMDSSRTTRMTASCSP